MNHLTEEQLILHYYGEEGDTLAAEHHLDECPGCREMFSSLQRVLNVVDSLPVPDPGAEYATRVWSQIEGRLPVRRRFQVPVLSWRWLAAGAAFAGLLVAAFLAGRFYPQPAKPQTMAAAADPQHGERVLLVAVGDYLERSQMVLIELTNAHPQKAMDITSQQERAGDLVSESRLYRQTAEHTGDHAVAGVLEELDRVLLDITHAPSKLSPGELETLRQRLEAEGILFKIRVMGSNVRNQEEPAGAGGTTTARQKL
ncbi:MAG TPA: hypothetical protein VG456_15245 [Candidatus Sulfopaludibacter sp.]|jgi:hypothetical protein|nr:hypothetical protein [Candidatus Sulfopaludibacter sp.]